MDGLLVIDKPSGPSSHDVVARVRRILNEHRIGHTGTLDPEATGVLPLVIGRATRLARFLSGADKSYEAVVRLGVSTNTYDAAGQAVGEPYTGTLPSREAIDSALDEYRGAFMQQPPAYSAKKIGGLASYKLARRTDRLRARGVEGTGMAAAEAAAPQLTPARVSATVIEILRLDADRVTLRMECSAGFYVRSLAHDLGQRLGTGAHLASLRRTRSGDAWLQDAVSLDLIEDGERGRERAIAAMIPLSRMLPALPELVLTATGLRAAVHGRELTPADLLSPASPLNPADPLSPMNYRLMDLGGNLVGLAAPARTPGLFHPFVVLM